MAERDGPRPPSSRSRDAAGEEFLFHLYRGSEMLQDNRVHDAKAELEHALALQPSDPKGQDLLGIVYFRLGLYPRAISIYERLIQIHPDAIEPRINLALSYLKTGQPAQARAALERVVEQNPEHSRAWGYLGLAFQRMGDHERASYAFAAGGHDAMARRVLEVPPAPATSLRPGAMDPPRTEVARIAGEAYRELDRDGPMFRADEEAPARTDLTSTPAPATRHGHHDLGRGPLSGDVRPSTSAWTATEPGREQFAPPPRLPAIGPPSSIPFGRASMLDGPSSSPRRPLTAAPKRALDMARETLLIFPRDLKVALHSSGVVLVQAPHGFATRIDAIRSMAYSAGYGTTVLQRRTRGRPQDEPLGGAVAPIMGITGKGELVLGPQAGQRLAPVQLDDDALYLREDALIGLDISVSYENGRLPVGDGESIAMVQLRGPGAVVLSLPDRASTIEVTEARSTAVRAGAVIGWVGRMVPRTLLASEAPAGVRGFVAFAGEGMVMVDGR